MEIMTSFSRRLALGLPLLVALVGLVALGCASKPPAPKLDDRVFLSQRVTENGAPRALVEGTVLQLTFQDGQRIGARAGCNTMSGSYTITEGRLVVSGAAQTRIGCAPERLAQDQWYFGFLQSKPSIVITGDTIVLEGGGIRLEYLDQEIATPDVSLMGRTWTVDVIIEASGVSSAVWPEPATIVFGTNGVVQVDTGCNTGSGTYQVSGNQLTFAGVSITERFCEGLTGRLERAVLGVVHGRQPVTWEITVDRLVLRGQNVGLELVTEG